MKVLLLGEYSGLHKYLKEGLQELGVDVTLLANGDFWKKLDGADGYLYHLQGNLFNRIYGTSIEPLLRMKEFRGYDVVQFINTLTFYHTINSFMAKRIKKNNGCISLVSAGYDTRLIEKYNEGFFEYYTLDYANGILRSFDTKHLKGRIRVSNDYRIEKIADVIIPSVYEYSVGYRHLKKTSIVIPFPINVDKIQYTENTVNNRIVFFHGLNREKEKGTEYIKTALDKLKNKYPNDVEIIIDGKMPFNEYLNMIRRANIIVDQCCSYGYGINACISMAQGKVVMSGARKETLEAFGVPQCPIIPIVPDVEQIYSQLEYIVKNKSNIPEWGFSSREYVEDLHHYVRVAQKYIDSWKSTGKIK